MRSIKRLPFLLLAILILIPLGSAYADAAPPMNPPGGNVSPEGGTQVQMAAEQVVIDFRQSTDDSANVTAWFLLHNTGNADEQLKVRFPLNGDEQGNMSGGTYIPLIEDFTAWIGGRQLSTREVKDDDPNAPVFFLGGSTVMYWAVFEVDFPVGKDVKLTVKYTLHPTVESGSDANVFYILATGAGWKGPIGSADVILRFPYILNLVNLPFFSETDNQTLVENEICYHWNDLEPAQSDNVSVYMVKPHLWQQVVERRAQVIGSPEDANAWLDLARAYYAAGLEKHGMFHDDQITSLYIHAFERAVELRPEDPGLHIEFAQSLLDSDPGIFSNDEYTLAIISNETAWALQLDPQNTGALKLLGELQQDFPNLTLPSPGPFPSRLASTPTLTVTQTPTPTLAPTNTPTPTHTPSLTPSKSPTVTLTPSPTPTPVSALSAMFGSKNKNSGWLALSALLLLAGACLITWRSVRSQKA